MSEQSTIPPVKGQKIKEVRKMTDEELENQLWDEDYHGKPNVIVLENGNKIFPSSDPEGNGYGALFGETEDGEGFMFE